MKKLFNISWELVFRKKLRFLSLKTLNKDMMNEDTVKEFTRKWLGEKQNVSEVLPEQLLFKPAEKLVSEANLRGIIPDFITKNDSNEVQHIIECKGHVSLNELIRGIGQVFTYGKLKYLNKQVTKNTEIGFVCPKSMNSLIDIVQFPEGTKIFLVDEKGNFYEKTKDRKKGEDYETELQLPKTFYLRDVEINHLEMLLVSIYHLSARVKGKLDRKKIDGAVKHHYGKPIAANSYNHFITLSSLGLIDSGNRLTLKGYSMAIQAIENNKSFRKEMMNEFYSYIINVINAILIHIKNTGQKLDEFKITGKDTVTTLQENYKQKIRFLNDERTTGTVLRILVEYGVLEKKGISKFGFNKLIHPYFLP